MRAVVIHAYGGPDELKFEEYPDPVVGAGDVLVRVAGTSVNPFDLKVRSGAMKEFVPLTFPAILGVDLSGTVERVGPGVDGYAPGDKVFAQASQTYASLCAVKAANLAKIPEGMELIDVAGLPTVTTTGAQLAELAMAARTGGTVLVSGAVGNVGRSAIFVAKENRWTVIAAVRRKQMEEAKATGADHVVALDDEMSLNRLEPVDAVADTISGQIADLLLAKVKKGGIFASVLAPPSKASAYSDVQIRTMQVKPAPATLLHMAEAVRSRRLAIPLGQRFALADANKAHTAAENRALGKLLLLA